MPESAAREGAGPDPAAHGLVALVVDDEEPTREELAWMLRQDPRVAEVHVAAGGAEALRQIRSHPGAHPVDVVFCDIKMPGVDGLDVARLLAAGSDGAPPRVVFVTAYDEHAVDAFEVRASDYVMKPVRPERLAEAVRRVVEARSAIAPAAVDDDETIAVELGGVTRFVRRSDVRYVEAHGDYARLHVGAATHLVRVPLSVLEERWGAAGFVRIHRSTLVSLRHVDEVRVDAGRCSVRLGPDVLQVARRHTRELRDRLVRAASPARER